MERVVKCKSNSYTYLINYITDKLITHYNNLSSIITDKLKGSSQVTHVRGKARFFYDYSFELSFVITNSSGEKLKGKKKLKKLKKSMSPCV